jgi:hypothetical protein
MFMADDENRESLFGEVEEVEQDVIAIGKQVAALTVSMAALSKKVDQCLFVANLIYIGMNPPPDGQPHLIISIGQPTEQ